MRCVTWGKKRGVCDCLEEAARDVPKGKWKEAEVLGRGMATHLRSCHQSAAEGLSWSNEEIAGRDARGQGMENAVTGQTQRFSRARRGSIRSVQALLKEISALLKSGTRANHQTENCRTGG